MEAIIGATYLSNGMETARCLVMRIIGPVLRDAAALGAGTDWKTSIQEIAAAQRMGVIDYKVTGFGPDHDRRFEAVLVIGGATYGSGSGRSKKEAEQEAASASWKLLQPEVNQLPLAHADAQLRHST